MPFIHELSSKLDTISGNSELLMLSWPNSLPSPHNAPQDTAATAWFKKTSLTSSQPSKKEQCIGIHNLIEGAKAVAVQGDYEDNFFPALFDTARIPPPTRSSALDHSRPARDTDTEVLGVCHICPITMGYEMPGSFSPVTHDTACRATLSYGKGDSTILPLLLWMVGGLIAHEFFGWGGVAAYGMITSAVGNHVQDS